jgi:hypothetical protein
MAEYGYGIGRLPSCTGGVIMEKQDVIRIAEGLRKIEDGVETIQAVMKEKKIKSLKDVAEELIPFFKKDDDSLTDSIISHLE